MEQDKCGVCLKTKELIKMKCGHSFCTGCIKQYIQTLKRYKMLMPDKLVCLEQSCQEQIDDHIISTIYKSEQGFILNIIKKRYKQSKDPSIVIFNCEGFTKNNRQPLIQKPTSMTREEHSTKTNQFIRDIKENRQKCEDKKICTNILSVNKSRIAKQKTQQCYVCGVNYCSSCLQFFHQGKCIVKDNTSQKFSKLVKIPQNFTDQSFNSFINANQLAKCLNPKCGYTIAKQQGCFWVKCRCSWQFCYPCQKIWGDCSHFEKYPYKKFTPPPEWMVKALNLY